MFYKVFRWITEKKIEKTLKNQHYEISQIGLLVLTNELAVFSACNIAWFSVLEIRIHETRSTWSKSTQEIEASINPLETHEKSTRNTVVGRD